MIPEEENRLLAKMFAASCVEQGREHAAYIFHAIDGLSIPDYKRVIVRFEVDHNYSTLELHGESLVLEEAYG